MGSGDWWKNIMSRKKTKQVKWSNCQEANGFKLKSRSRKESTKLLNSTSIVNRGNCGMDVEDLAATRIQTAFRGFKARKTLHSLKRIQKLQVFTNRSSIKKQVSNTLSNLQSWSKIQAEIRARRVNMVLEGRIRQKKHDNQLKLEAKLHELEVEWCGGSETKEEIITRIQQREEAAVKRERAMAYAFSHQWRANSGVNQGTFLYDIGKGNWGWSWVDQWIAARPWEARLPVTLVSPNKSQIKVSSKVGNNLSAQKLSASVKPINNGGKGSTKKSRKPSEEEAFSKEQNIKPVNSPRGRTKSNLAAKIRQEQIPSQASQSSG